MPIDFEDPDVIRDPYPALAKLREQAPVSWHEPTGMWLAASHAAADAVLRDRRVGRFWIDREPAEVWEPFNLLHRNQMMENEPPDHTRLRSLVAKAFARGRTATFCGPGRRRSCGCTRSPAPPRRRPRPSRRAASSPITCATWPPNAPRTPATT